MKLIDKDALVAEIEKRIVEYKDMKIDSSYYEGMVASLEFFRDEFINTLKVKEVDLQKEIDRVWDNTSDNFSEDGWKEFEDIAKHFFELGISINNSTKVTTPDVDDVLKENGVNPDSKEAKIIKESYFMAIEKLAQKGEEV